MAGRPNTYDFDLCVEICNEIANGLNVKTVLASSDKYPTFQTWCNWKRDNNQLFDLYIKSIQDKSESVDEEIDNIMQGLKEGTYDPSTANVLIQTLKWKAAKYYPKMFGDKVQNEVTVMNIPVLTNDPLADTNESDNSTQENIGT
jgi:alkyl hydroperoxide reductase subunit AhpC